LRGLFCCSPTQGVLSDTLAAQALTGALIGTVKDAQGGVLRGAQVRLTSPVLIAAHETVTTNAASRLFMRARLKSRTTHGAENVYD
jgi:hypothetical protein